MISAGKRLRAKWEAGEPVFGLWAGLPSSLTAELAGLAGYDYVCVDLQHGLNTEATLVDVPGRSGRRRGSAGPPGVDQP